MRCRFFTLLMIAMVTSAGFLIPSAQAGASAEIDFWIEKVDPVTKKGEKASIYTFDDYLSYVTVIKNNGTEHISTADVKYKVTLRDYSVGGIPRLATRFLPSTVEWKRNWEVNLKSGEEKRIDETKSMVDWTKFLFSLLGYTLVSYNAAKATGVVDGKLGPFTIKGAKVNAANSQGTVAVELFINGKSFGKKSCEYTLIAKAD
jgi:hypothetical protein